MTIQQPLSSDQQLILHLSLIDGVGPVAVRHLLDALRARSLSLNLLHTFLISDCVAQCGVSPTIARKLVTGLRDTCLLERELQLIAQNEVRLLTILDDEYPPLLKEIYAAPPVLYCRGSLPVHDGLSVAVVGSRAAHQYGQRAVDLLVPGLVQQGCVIVSGGALGADCMAHEAALRAGGVTYAVLGSGLLKFYPARNKKLFERIVQQGGALLSPFPLQMEAMPGNFPARNRIIAGLSRACVIIQAAAKSGAIITARYALEQGREVFAVPGAIDDPLSAGCHALLAEGAALATSADAVLGQLGIAADRCRVAEPNAVPEVVPVTHPLLQACQEPCGIDALAAQTGLTIDQVQIQLFDLQLAGQVIQTVAGQWQAV